MRGSETLATHLIRASETAPHMPVLPRSRGRETSAVDRLAQLGRAVGAELCRQRLGDHLVDSDVLLHRQLLQRGGRTVEQGAGVGLPVAALLDEGFGWRSWTTVSSSPAPDQESRSA